MKLPKTLFAGSVFAALVLGVGALTAPAASARPVLLCGPAFMWSCSAPGGPNVLFAGTLCEARLYEMQTGQTCTPIVTRR